MKPVAAGVVSFGVELKNLISRTNFVLLVSFHAITSDLILIFAYLLTSNLLKYIEGRHVLWDY